MKNSNCERCGLYESRRNIVIDRGNPSSKLMIIGEAPGKNEDIEGKAFVGKAGKLLDEIMKAISLNTEEDLLIANVVKCRPPENRSPLREEVSACLPYLHKQIELIQPRVIVLLGAVALKHMIPEKKDFSMAEEAGTFFSSEDYPGVQFLVLYHPAYLLYDPRKKQDMWEHVKQLKVFLEKNNVL
ncbi:MAG: uracil-DNA glycosylase [Deltaproteobacteria bacterium]|nr:uracil-DNA glycosylase [Deltaproteobacteria bacterium]MCK5421735.1 uracil-DNA glycosylase [Deltaproteobacteria bacterium]